MSPAGHDLGNDPIGHRALTLRTGDVSDSIAANALMELGVQKIDCTGFKPSWSILTPSNIDNGIESISPQETIGKRVNTTEYRAVDLDGAMDLDNKIPSNSLTVRKFERQKSLGKKPEGWSSANGAS